MRSGRVGLTVVVAVLAAGVGVWGGVYHFALGAPNPCAGIVTPSSPTNATAAGPVPAAPPASGAPTGPTGRSSSGPVVNVVAAENFWGSLVSQLGGTHVNVTSIITDPNTDPHEYEANDSDAKAIKNAQYVIVNNVGYDDWATSLIAADGDTNQTVLNIGDMLGVSVTGGIVTGNPHLWYNPAYVNRTVQWMYDNLTTIAPSLTSYFRANLENLTASLASLYQEVGLIRHLFSGTVVASTESIFVYLANATGLDLVSPPAFMEAVAEGNDPPDQSVVTFQCQLESGNVRVLVFNAQTVTPITTSMKAIAEEHNVSVTSVTETIVPPNDTFQEWMGGELNALYVALDAAALGR